MAHLLMYPCQPIYSLSPGAQEVSFYGCVVNITWHEISRASAPATKGRYELLVKDGSGEILVRAWYNNKTYDEIRLGQWLKVSTTHVSSAVTPCMSSDTIRGLPASIVTSVFPERDSGCDIEVLKEFHEHGSLSVIATTQFLTLEEYFHNGKDTQPHQSMILVVLGISSPRTVTTKTKTPFDTVDLLVVDSSCFQLSSTVALSVATLSLTPPLFASALAFVPKHTVLVVFKTRILSSSHRRFALTPRSQVLVNPPCAETELLRGWVERVLPTSYACIKPEAGSDHCKPSNHLSTFDMPFDVTVPRKQYTLALFLEEISLRQKQAAMRPAYWRRLAKSSAFLGFVSVLITRIPLVQLFQNNQMFCGTCPMCATELFANRSRVSHSCTSKDIDIGTKPRQDVFPNLGQHRTVGNLRLSWNSQILCGFSDETGGLLLHTKDDRHNIHLTDEAVRGLTGLSKNDFVTPATNPSDSSDAVWQAMYAETVSNTADDALLSRLRWIEKQVSWSRLTLVLSWSPGHQLDGCEKKRGYRSISGCKPSGPDRGTKSIVVLNVLS